MLGALGEQGFHGGALLARVFFVLEALLLAYYLGDLALREF